MCFECCLLWHYFLSVLFLFLRTKEHSDSLRIIWCCLNNYLMFPLAKNLNGPFKHLFSGQEINSAILCKLQKEWKLPYFGSFSSTVFSSSHMSFTSPFLMLLYETSIMKMKAGGLGGLFFYMKASKSHTYKVHTFHNQIKAPRNSRRSSDLSFNILWYNICGVKSLSGPVSATIKKIKAVYFPGCDLSPTTEVDRIMTASREGSLSQGSEDLMTTPAQRWVQSCGDLAYNPLLRGRNVSGTLANCAVNSTKL